jgi:spermidine synthase
MFEDNKPEIIFSGESQFTHITIIEMGGIRTMCMGKNAEEAETSISLRNPEEPIFEYPGLFFLSLALRPLARRVVMLGLGGGFIPRLCQRHLPEHQLTVVEIDPLVVDLASVYFGFSPGANVEVVTSDGLAYLALLPPRSVDILWLDAFNGDYIPNHLSTKQFLSLTRSVLHEDGLLVQNLHQSRWSAYLRQLALTQAIFEEPPLLFSGVRCANTIAICPNGPKSIARLPKELALAARAFGGQVGPYDLMEESRKLIPFPPLPASTI